MCLESLRSLLLMLNSFFPSDSATCINSGPGMDTFIIHKSVFKDSKINLLFCEISDPSHPVLNVTELYKSADEVLSKKVKSPTIWEMLV